MREGGFGGGDWPDGDADCRRGGEKRKRGVRRRETKTAMSTKQREGVSTQIITLQMSLLLLDLPLLHLFALLDYTHGLFCSLLCLFVAFLLLGFTWPFSNLAITVEKRVCVLVHSYFVMFANAALSSCQETD